MGIDRTHVLFSNYLDLVSNNLGNPNEIDLLTNQFFSKEIPLYNACRNLVSQILYQSNSTKLMFKTDEVYYRDLVYLMRVADLFGRFDLGYRLRWLWILSLENKVFSDQVKRSDCLIYLWTKQIFGDDLFQFKDMRCVFKVPFYLKSIHEQYFDDFINHSIKDTTYFKRINGKRIALLAPGILEFNEELTSELEEFDEIIPITYTSTHFNSFPLKIKISYYNYQNAKKILNNQLNNDTDGLDFYCLKSIDSAIQGHRRILEDLNKWFIGHPNMVQCSVYDLLKHQPSKIKIYGMNFFLSKNTHHAAYPTVEVSSLKLSSHNIISNFLYIENLYHKSIILLDNESEQIIRSGLQSYVNEMTNLYRFN